MSFGVCLFLQGVIRKYGGKAHTSGLHRDINVCGNFLSSRRLQKPQEAERAQGQGARPPPFGACPATRANQVIYIQVIYWILACIKCSSLYNARVVINRLDVVFSLAITWNCTQSCGLLW